MLNANEWANGVNRFTGNIGAMFDLLQPDSEKKPDGVNKVVLPVAYDSGVWKTASTWNLEAPTGVLGLGWNLGLEMIVADLRYTAPGQATRYFWLSPTGSSPLVCIGNNNGVLSFALAEYAFWNITYAPASELWLIIKEDGTRHLFGDKSSQRNTVQWGITWGNWIGSGNQVAGQANAAVAWNLSQVLDLWGQATTYTYDAVTQAVTSAPVPGSQQPVFTQASYLKRIVGVTGDAAVLHYAEKDPSEYQDPHTAPPNAYQDRFETRYLSSVDYVAPTGNTLFTMTLLYDNGQGQTLYLGSGAYTKRLLTGLRCSWTNGSSLPAIRFSYYSAADGVSVTRIFNAANNAVYGALKQVTLPEGGTVQFHYNQQSLGLSNRQISLAAPTVSGYTFSRPRFAFADGYVVLTWYGEKPGGANPIMQVTALTWDGRWLAATLNAIPVAGSAAYDALPIQTQDHFFGVLAGQSVYLYRRNDNQAGQWVAPAVGGSSLPYFTTGIAAAEATLFAGGEDFAAVLGTTSGMLYQYHWNGQAWQSDGSTTLTTGGSPSVFTAAAQFNVLYTVGTAVGGSDTLHATLFFLTSLGAWQSNAFTAARSYSTLANLAVSVGAGFAVVQEVAVQGTGSAATYRAFNWNATCSNLTANALAALNFPTGKNPYSIAICGSGIALGQHMYRYNGQAWVAQNLSSIAFPGGSTLSGIQYGLDQVSRIIQTGANAYTYDLVAWNPNTGTWNEPGNLHFTGASANVGCTTARTRRQPSPFAIVNNTLYAQQGDASWAQQATMPNTLTGNDLASLQILESAYVIYQNSGNVSVLPLQNGTAGTAIPLNGQSLVIPGSAPSTLVGFRAFATYTGTYGTAGSQLTLYRVVNQQATGAQPGYTVTGILINNGYQTITTGLSYTLTQATIDAAGLRPQFNQVTRFDGSENPASKPYGYRVACFFNGLAASESPALPYPNNPTYANTGSYYSRLKGALYAEQTYDASNNLVAGQEKDWMLYALVLGGLGQGVYMRLSRELPMLDGVTGQVLYTYSTMTGLVTQTSTRNYNSSGIEEDYQQQFAYFWEQYDPNRTLNILSPVIQTTRSTVTPSTSSTVVTGIEAVTWQSDWGHGAGQWALWQTFLALSATATFTHWNGGGGGDPQWLLISTVTNRLSTGLANRSTDVNGIVHSAVFDAAQWQAQAQFSNADATGGEANYYGFETYEAEGGWGWSDPDGSLAQNIVTTDFHTGSRCLQLPSVTGQQVGPQCQFQPVDQSRPYLFSCWAKTPSGFNPAQGAANWQIALYRADNNQPVGQAVAANIPATQNAWMYLQKTIDLPGIRAANSIPDSVALYFILTGYNQNSANLCWVDNLRWSPLNGNTSVNVTDPDQGHVVSTLGNNGETDTFVFDNCHRCIAQVGSANQVKWASDPAFSRELGAGDAFMPEFPNSALQLRTTSNSRYYDFRDGNTSDWTFTQGNWGISGGLLNYAPASPTAPLGGTATLNIFAFTNFAVRVACNTAATGNAGIGNGDVFAYWNGTTSTWTLARMQSGGTLATAALSGIIGLGTHWVFAIVEGVVLFYVDGIQVFSLTYTPNTALANVGKPVLTLLQAGSFDDLLVLNDPQLSLAFIDGLGGAMQNVAYLGSATGSPQYPVLGSGVLWDALGRPAYSRVPLDAPLSLAAPGAGPTPAQLVAGNQSTYLVDSSGNPLTVSQFLAGQGGQINYGVQQFESSPLSRVTASVLPHETSAAAADFTTQYAYLTTAASGTGSVMNDLLPSGSNGLYHLHQSIDPDGIEQDTLLDQAGRMVAQRIRQAGAAYGTQFFQYSPSGQPTTINTPNYYDPPGGSAAAKWQQTQSFDFLGRRLSATTPDSGTTQYLHDASGRLRFEMTAQGAAASPQAIRYYKYDALNRLAENGILRDSRYPWSSLAAQTGVADFPDTQNTQSPNYAQGQWYQKSVYDASPGQADAPNLLGRLSQRQTNNSGGVQTEIFAYDGEGNILSHSQQIANIDTAAYLTQYTYNNLGQISSIQYPAIAGGNALTVGYYYNRLGQMASVGDVLSGTEVVDPANPANAGEEYYAAYSYDGLGNVAGESLNNGKGNAPGTQNPNAFQRQYAYTPQGWIQNIEDPYFRETIGYYQDPNHAYYDGRIAQAETAYKPGPWADPPADYQYNFSYDALGRLTRAQNTLNDAWSLTLGSTTQSGYDANGNILSQTRGGAANLYAYAPNGQSPANNRLDHQSVTADTAPGFGNTPLNPGWTYGSANGGATTSAVVTDPTLGKVLQLGGGSVGHYESLRLQTYLDPAGTYTLGYQAKTDGTFAAGLGQAGWILRFYNLQGEVFTSSVSPIANTNDAWSPQTVNLDLAHSISSLGLGLPIDYVVLECVNYLCASSGSGSGPSVYIAAPTVSLANALTKAPLAYDAGGNVIAAPGSGLTTLGYHAFTNLTATVSMADSNVLTYGYNGGDLRSLEVYSNSAGTKISSVRTLRSYDGKPLIRIDDNPTQYIHGPLGLVAQCQAGAVAYPLRDHLGSTRALVDGSSGSPLGNYDYLPFGGIMRSQPASHEPAYRFTGQEWDSHSGLYNYNAREYQPDLQRFLSPDDVDQGISPYAYVGNDPVGRVDPSGHVDFPILNITHPSRQRGTLTYVPPPAEPGMSLSEWVIDTIFKSRSNLAELNSNPRQDMSLGEWIYNGPSWFYIPYIKFSPTEIATVAWHFGAKPGVDVIRNNWAMLIFKSWKSTMYATVYNPLPGNHHLAWTFFKKGVLRTGYDVLKAYHNLYKDFSRLNQEARDFREDLKSDPWVKNAYRHSYWMCRYTQEFGYDFALDLGYAHEYAHLDLTIEGPFDSFVDKINNMVGAKLGLIPGGNCSALVNQAGAEAALAWAKSYGIHAPEEFNVQQPLDILKRNYTEVPIFNYYDIRAMAQLGIMVPLG